MKTQVPQLNIIDPYDVEKILLACGDSDYYIHSQVNRTDCSGFRKIVDRKETSNQTLFRENCKSLPIIRDPKRGYVLRDQFFNKGFGRLVTDIKNDSIMIFHWRVFEGNQLVFPIHWHRQTEVILQVLGESFIWGKCFDSYPEFWSSNIRKNEYLALAPYSAHASTMTGEFYVGFAPRHEFEIVDGCVDSSFDHLFPKE